MGLSGGLVDNGGLFPSASEMPQQSVDVGSRVLQSSSYATFAAFIAAIPSGGRGLVTPGTYPLTASVTISKSLGLEFQAGAVLQKSAAFADAQAILASGSVTVEIDAPQGSTFLDGNQSAGATGHGIATSGAPTLTIRGGRILNNNGSGVFVNSSLADVKCYGVESSLNITGSNTGNGFWASAGGKLRTWECIANQNDRMGFFFDRQASSGCRLDGYAYFNSINGATLRSYRGHIGQFVAESNIKGGLAVEFGGDSWKGGTVYALNNGVGEEVIATLASSTTVTVASAEAWWGGQTITDLAGNIPAGTTIVGPVAAGATTITLSQAATATGQTTVAIGNTSGFGVEIYGGTRCQFKVVDRNNSGYGVALTAMASPLSTTISNGGSQITAAQTIIPVTSLSSWPTGGLASIESELIFYRTVSGNSLVGCTRGAYGTTAATHADTTAVTQPTIPRSHQIDIDSDNLNAWDNDPAIHLSGGAERNHFTGKIAGRSFAVSIGETFGSGNHNLFDLFCDTISTAIIRISNGSNNRFKIKARDCWNSSGSWPALFYFSAADSGAATTGNIIDSDWEHRTINRPAPTATITEVSGATGNEIATPRITYLGSPGILQNFSRITVGNASGNITTAPTSGTLYCVGGEGPYALVIPAGQAIANVAQFFTGTTAPASVTSWWYCLISQVASHSKILAVSADNAAAPGGNSANTNQPLALAYTPDVDTPVWFGYCIAATTMPTLFGIDVNSMPSNEKVVTPVLAGTFSGQTGLTGPVAVGTDIGAPTNFRNVPWVALS